MVKTIKLARVPSDRGEPMRCEIRVGLRRIETPSPHLTVDLERCMRLTELAVTHTTWYPGDRANDPSSGGCGTEDIRRYWGDDPRIVELCDLADRWHLNDLRPGTRAQQEYLAANPIADRLDWYGSACKALELAGLLIDNGFRFGSKWLAEPMPPSVMRRIGRLVRELGGK